MWSTAGQNQHTLENIHQQGKSLWPVGDFSIVGMNCTLNGAMYASSLLRTIGLDYVGGASTDPPGSK